jgi:hypothetical protein
MLAKCLQNACKVDVKCLQSSSEVLAKIGEAQVKCRRDIGEMFLNIGKMLARCSQDARQTSAGVYGIL